MNIKDLTPGTPFRFVDEDDDDKLYDFVFAGMSPDGCWPAYWKKRRGAVDYWTIYEAPSGAEVEVTCDT